MTKEETAERIKVMQAYVDGKQIQVAGENGDWIDLDSLNEQPTWGARLDYRIKPEPTLRPYKSTNEAFQESKKHGFWVIDETGCCHAITFIGSAVIYVCDDELDYDNFLRNFRWADDCSPCGIIE